MSKYKSPYFIRQIFIQYILFSFILDQILDITVKKSCSCHLRKSNMQTLLCATLLKDSCILVPPTHTTLSIMVWLIHTDREAIVYTLSVSMETATWDTVSYEITDIYLALSQDKTVCVFALSFHDWYLPKCNDC